VADERLVSLEDIARRLEDGARRLRDDGLDPEAAIQLAGECAELASQAAVELDRIARLTGSEPAEVDGQEELL
jgi:exonuclease VII small subunit